MSTYLFFNYYECYLFFLNSTFKVFVVKNSYPNSQKKHIDIEIGMSIFFISETFILKVDVNKPMYSRDPNKRGGLKIRDLIGQKERITLRRGRQNPQNK